MIESHHATAFSGGVVWNQSHDNLALRGRWIEHSDPQAPVIHLIHGNGFACDMYAPSVAPLLKRAGLFTHDMQGHGLSDPGTEFVGLDKTAARIGAVLHGAAGLLADRKVIAIGHSFGALATLKYAAANPNAFEAVVLIDPVIFSPEQLAAIAKQTDGGSNLLAEQALARGTQWPSRAAAFEYFNGRKSLSSWHPAGLEAYINGVLRQEPDGSYSLRCPPWMEAAIFSQRSMNYWSDIAAIKTPTLAIYGEQSFDFIKPNLQRAAEMNGAISVVGTRGGHCFTQEFPDALGRLLRDFAPVEILLNNVKY